MPFTPFHFGAGALVHAVAPRRISFLAFCAANVLIDVEPLAHMLRREIPVHGFAHSVVGLASATQNFDGNGYRTRYEFGGGPNEALG